MFSRERAVLLAAMLALTATMTTPALGTHALFKSMGPCPPSGSVEPTSQLQKITSSLGDGCNSNSSSSDRSSWVTNPPPDGTDCSHDEDVPATVHRDGDLVTITYTDPRTQQLASGTVRASEFGGTKPAAGQEWNFDFPFQGTFQHGVCTGQYLSSPCPHQINMISGAPWPFPACMAQQPLPVGGMLPGSTILSIWFDIKTQLSKLYTLGMPQSLPAVRGLVNVASCFWLVGDNAPLDQRLQLVLIAPGVGMSPNIIYTLVIQITAPGVDWHFDDPGDPTNSQSDVPTECAGTPAMVAHRYLADSGGSNRPDGTFHVTASQTYQILATLDWIDYFGSYSEPVPLTPDESTLTLTSSAYHFPVIQEEGVPIG